MKSHMGPFSIPLVFASLFLLLALTVAISHPASAQSAPAAPANLRVDISDGTTGQLFVSWDQVTGMNGATYYELQRWTAQNPTPVKVANCSDSKNASILDTPWVSKICRDNNDGGNPPLTVGTTYYYQVQACNTTGCSGNGTPQTPASYYNTPVSSDCALPPMRGVKAPAPILVPTSSLVPPPNPFTFLPTANEIAAYPYLGSPIDLSRRQNKLVVNLPGSAEKAGRGQWVYIAQNLGFDVISVNYENQSQQETICQASAYITMTADAANCFTNISQAKLNAMGVCNSSATATRKLCGTVPNTTSPYILSNPYDAVKLRITTMLQYLCTYDNGNQYGTDWGQYLSPVDSCTIGSNTDPNWNKIILGGHSQGGDMATFAADKAQINRAINLSAPPQATAVSGTETAASYFADFATGASMTSIRSIYGLVSQHDTTRYNKPANADVSVYQAVWTALGYNIPANNDAEWKLNVPGALQPLVCSSTASHNFSTKAVQSPGGGHADPIYIWNEDIFEYMLINQL